MLLRTVKGGTLKNKTKTILFFAVPFSPPSTSIKLISEYTHTHAHTAHLKGKKSQKIWDAH